MKCDFCLNARPIISENGIHYACCLSSREAARCMTDGWKLFLEHPGRRIPELKGFADTRG